MPRIHLGSWRLGPPTLRPGRSRGTTRSSDAYAWTNHYAVNRNHTANGLNQYTAAGGITPTYDARGNMQESGGWQYYSYSSENMLTSAWSQATLNYDPLRRLWEIGNGTTTTRMLYDGATLIGEYNSSHVAQRRHVHGPGVDEPLVRYDGTGTSTRFFYHADERGSIVATSDSSGAMANINTYDEYGIPGSGNTGTFQYTGQQWLSQIRMYHYRARIYSPTLGRFMQTDPIGYGDGMNMYAYVRGDPVNRTDPSGLCGPDEIMVYRTHLNASSTRGEDGVETVMGPPKMCISPSDFLRGGLFYGFDPFGYPTPPTSDELMEDLIDGVRSKIRDVLCAIPPIGAGIGAESFAGPGGGVSGGVSFNPANGQVSVFGSEYVGVGIGGGGYAFATVGAPTGLSLNAVGGASITAGPGFSVSGSGSIIGTNPGSISVSGAAARVGPEVSLNATAGAEMSFPVTPQLYSLGCN